MAKLPQLKRSLHDLIDDTNSSCELSALLPYVDVDAFKQFLHQQLEESFNPCAIRSAYYAAMPMDKILPSELNQHMLSFAGWHHTKAVSKTWKSYAEKIETKRFRKLYENINSNYSLFKADPNQVIVVDAHRSELHAVEQELGYRCVGPVKTIKAALQQSGDGDCIVVHDGVYKVGDLRVMNNVRFIGESHTVEVIGNKPEDSFVPVFLGRLQTCICIGYDRYSSQTCAAFVRNIRFRNLEFEVRPNCRLHLDGCHATMRNARLVDVVKDAVFTATDCTFVQTEVGFWPRDQQEFVKISAEARYVKLNGCEFINEYNQIPQFSDTSGAIGIQCPSHVRSEGDTYVDLQCVGNVFSNLPCYAFAERSYNKTGYFRAATDKCMLTDNACTGPHSNKVEANRLYQPPSSIDWPSGI